jgi:hypothetical protein
MREEGKKKKMNSRRFCGKWCSYIKETLRQPIRKEKKNAISFQAMYLYIFNQFFLTAVTFERIFNIFKFFKYIIHIEKNN